MTDKPKYYVKKFGEVLADEVCCADPDLSSQDAISGALALNSGVVQEEDSYYFCESIEHSYVPKEHLVMVRKK